MKAVRDGQEDDSKHQEQPLCLEGANHSHRDQRNKNDWSAGHWKENIMRGDYRSDHEAVLVFLRPMKSQ